MTTIASQQLDELTTKQLFAAVKSNCFSQCAFIYYDDDDGTISASFVDDSSLCFDGDTVYEEE